MDYKELHQDCYEALEERLKREPLWREIEEEFHFKISSIQECYKS